jgi:hypothetical protein
MKTIFEKLEIADEDIRKVCDKFFSVIGEVKTVHAKKDDCGLWDIEVVYNETRSK